MDYAPAGHAVFNVCTERATTVLELARTIADLCGKLPEIHHKPERSGEIRHSIGSAAAARAKLSLPEATGLRTGLGQVLAWLDRSG
jgi:UDP-glucose 4-epimerase